MSNMPLSNGRNVLLKDHSFIAQNANVTHKANIVQKANRVLASGLIVLSTLGVGIITGCSQSEDSYNHDELAAVDVGVDVSDEPLESLNTLASEPLQVANISEATEQTLGSVVSDNKALGKSLIITVKAIFKVNDVVDSNKAIETLTRQQSGYVASSAITNQQIDSQIFTQDGQDIILITYRRQSEMTVRIPSEQVNDFLSQLQKQVKFLEYHKFEAKDVTLDIQRERLASELEKNMADELGKERLNSEDADEQNSNVDSIVATYDAKRRAQYAQLQRMNIEDKVKYSTIDLTFTEPPIVFKEVTPNLETVTKQYEPSFLTQAGTALSKGWNDLKVAIIAILRLWWLWLLLIASALVVKALRSTFHYALKKDKNSKS